MNKVIENQQEIIDDLSFFESWEDKYMHIISLGKSLKPFPEEKKTVEYLVKGCQSQVWFDANFENGILNFMAESDALIVSGLIAILIDVYNEATPQDILESNTDFIQEIGFGSHLSVTRSNGLHSMLNYIYATAKNFV